MDKKFRAKYIYSGSISLSMNLTPVIYLNNTKMVKKLNASFLLFLVFYCYINILMFIYMFPLLQGMNILYCATGCPNNIYFPLK